MELAPGNTVAIEITAAPKSAAAFKTLARICSKDPAVLRERRRLKGHRPSWQDWRRGGKLWHHQMKSGLPAEIALGAKFTVRATVDVIRDLASVQKYVSVTTK
jgi:hypothetical protein